MERASQICDLCAPHTSSRLHLPFMGALSRNQVSLEVGVNPKRINENVLDKRRITADTALRLARYFGIPPQFWMGLQND
jgi:addiction module HigA family antidote